MGVSALVIGRHTAREQIGMLKRQGRTVIAGGPDPSIVPGIYLKEYGADYVVVGEGELTALELMDTLTGRSARPIEEVQGIAYLRDGELRFTRAREKIQDLDSLPWPARDLMDFAPYLRAWRDRHGYSSVHLLTSRGCPFPLQLVQQRRLRQDLQGPRPDGRGAGDALAARDLRARAPLDRRRPARGAEEVGDAPGAAPCWRRTPRSPSSASRAPICSRPRCWPS